MRVQAGSLAEMRKKEQEKRMAVATTATTFTYDMDTCRQYQSRGTASVGHNMSAVSQATHASSYGAATAFAGGPSHVMYNWTPGTTAGYGDSASSSSSGHATSGTSSAGTGMTYGGMSYHGIPYHGMPSPDTSYMGENDLIDRPSTSSMADAGAFALQSMSQGLPTSGSSPYGHNNHGMGATSTPRSLPGPPTVLGSSRGVPPSAVFSASRSGGGSGAPQQYPSPATTPITSGVSPVWTGYEQSPYASAAPMQQSNMAGQSLERLPDMYAATPSSAGESGGGGGGGGGSSPHGEDEGPGGDGGHHHQTQQQQHHFGYDYGDSRAHPEGGGGGEEHAAAGVDGVSNHSTASGSY